MSTEYVFFAIKERISRHEWAEGSPIDGEASLANLYQKSRTTIRAVLGQLAAEGLLRPRAGVGWIVTKPKPKTEVSISARSSSSTPSEWRKCREFELDSTHSLGNELPNPSDVVINAPMECEIVGIDAGPNLTPSLVAQKLALEFRDRVVWFSRCRSSGSTKVAVQWTVVPARLLEVKKMTQADLVPGGITQLFHANELVRHHCLSEVSLVTISDPQIASLMEVDRRATFLKTVNVSSMYTRRAELMPFDLTVTLFTKEVVLRYESVDRAIPQ